MDVIFIKDLAVECVVGVCAWERQVRQKLALDVCVAHDFQAAAAAERVGEEGLTRTIDYSVLGQQIQDFIGGADFFLLEALAEQTAAMILGEFPVPWVWLRVHKHHALPGATVGVVVERGIRPPLPLLTF